VAENVSTEPPSPKNIIIASALAGVVALLVLLAAILPAEYGIDPLGTGELLGLTALSRDQNPFDEQAEIHRSDFVEFVLEPFQSVEYKYLLDLDAPMVFSWVADGDLYYDMHAEPAGLGEDYAESFEQGVAARQMGSFHAPFTGIHGWFWENRSLNTVLVRLYSAGFYQYSTVFRDRGTFDRTMDSVTD